MEIFSYLILAFTGIIIWISWMECTEKRLEKRTDETSRIKRVSRSKYSYEYRNKRIRSENESTILFWKQDDISTSMEARLRHRVREKVRDK